MTDEKFNEILNRSESIMDRAWRLAVNANIERRNLTEAEQAEIDSCIKASGAVLSSFNNCQIED